MRILFVFMIFWCDFFFLDLCFPRTFVFLGLLFFLLAWTTLRITLETHGLSLFTLLVFISMDITQSNTYVPHLIICIYSLFMTHIHSLPPVLLLLLSPFEILTSCSSPVSSLVAPHWKQFNLMSHRMCIRHDSKLYQALPKTGTRENDGHVFEKSRTPSITLVLPLNYHLKRRGSYQWSRPSRPRRQPPPHYRPSLHLRP